jgi:two-component system sensor histidine kinase/response regulator
MTRILVIEDMPILREDILNILAFEGYETLGAENGRAGLEQMRDWQPDLVICDIMMPELDGYGVLAEVRKQKLWTNLPFIFLTARIDRPDVRQGMDMGADDYLTKPFSPTELIASVRARLEKQESLKAMSEQKLEDLRNRIIISLPHELRTPLTSILGYSDILLEDAAVLDAQQVKEIATAINASAQRLWHVAENYLLYTRIEMARAIPDYGDALASEAITNADELVEAEAFQRAQRVQRESDLAIDLTFEPVVVRISSDHLCKIVSELVDNALKFSEKGSRVSVSARMTPDGLYSLSVSDEGRGMTPQLIASVGAFMQFERHIYEQQGLGLGLVICRSLAELRGGSLHIESTPLQGTTVRVALPGWSEQR